MVFGLPATKNRIWSYLSLASFSRTRFGVVKLSAISILFVKSALLAISKIISDGVFLFPLTAFLTNFCLSLASKIRILIGVFGFEATCSRIKYFLSLAKMGRRVAETPKFPARWYLSSSSRLDNVFNH